MHAHRFLLAGLALGLAGVTSRVAATTVEPPSVDRLVGQSDYVVRAVVKTATAEWKEKDGKPYISTRLEMEVREVIKGTPPSPLVLDMLGGKIGDVEFEVSGMPVFHVGDENILFVRGNQRTVFPLVAMMHGVYPILKDARTGQDYVLRCNGTPLYATADVSLPMSRASTVLQKNPSARPLTARAFIQEIRQRGNVVARTHEK